MKDAKALRALRDLKNASNEEKLGLIASYLGKYEEAKEIYSKAKRDDLKNQLLQSTSAWEKTLDTGSKASLKKEFFKFGNHLNDIQDDIGAIAAYEKSENP